MILLNDNILSHIDQKGITRFFRRITDGIIQHFGAQVTVLSPDVRDYKQARYIRSLGYPGRIHDLTASALACVTRPHVVLNPYYGNMRSFAAEIYIVYDMIHELFPEHMNQRTSYERRFVAEKKRCLEKSSHILAISSSTARDILACYPHIDPNKITVVHLGVDEFFLQQVGSRCDLQGKPFLLYVGHRWAYKNFARLLEAFGQSGLAGGIDLRVVSSEGSSISDQEIDLIDRYNLEDSVHWLGTVSEETLREQYASSLAYVYPSEYEGFGLPILEAMASGTIVATSNVSSMPEVGGDAAFYFDPYDTESIAVCLREIAELPEECRRERIAQGRARARTFTWDRCVNQVADVLRQFM